MREMLFQIVHCEGHGFFGKRLAQMFRVVLLEAAGAQVAAEQGSEASGEAFAEAVGYLHHIFLFHSACRGADADEHKCALHKAALATETPSAVQADS